MGTYGDWNRVINDEPFEGPVYYASLIIGLVARFLLGFVIMLMLCKNEEAAGKQQDLDEMETSV